MQCEFAWLMLTQSALLTKYPYAHLYSECCVRFGREVVAGCHCSGEFFPGSVSQCLCHPIVSYICNIILFLILFQIATEWKLLLILHQILLFTSDNI